MTYLSTHLATDFPTYLLLTTVDRPHRTGDNCGNQANSQTNAQSNAQATTTPADRTQRTGPDEARPASNAIVRSCARGSRERDVAPRRSPSDVAWARHLTRQVRREVESTHLAPPDLKMARFIETTPIDASAAFAVALDRLFDEVAREDEQPMPFDLAADRHADATDAAYGARRRT